MRRKAILFFAVLLAAMSLSACSLLPQEEEVRTAPLLRDYEREEYTTALVERGDLTLIEKVTCKYVPVQTVSLSFALGGEYVDRMMVQVGDSVEQGQLLGQLQLGDLEERVAAAQSAIEELQLRSDYVEEMYQIELRRNAIDGETMDAQACRERQDALEEDFEARRKDVENALELQRMTLEALERSLDERQIRAPFSGTITYVRRYKDGDMSAFGDSAVTLVDSTMSLFRAETKYWDRFHEGDEYEILVNKVPYVIVVASEESLGLPAREKEPDKQAYVYFVLKEASFELSDGDYGTIELIRDQRLNVLHVPSNAVLNAGDKQLVYYQREDGMKGYKEVETGITVNRRTEIISGLSEGESIIVK